MPRKPRTTTKRNRGPQLQLVYPLRDQIEALRTQSEYQRCLQLWQSILKKEKRGLPLTEWEAALKHNAPRSRFSVEAEAEAREKLLSRTYRQLGAVTEGEWAWRYAPCPELDEVHQRLNVSIPMDLPFTAIGPHIERLVQQAKRQLDLPSPQRVRRPEVDPWQVYRLKYKEHVEPLDIARRLFKLPPGVPPEEDETVRQAYEKVLRALKYAERVIASVTKR